jgi:hypothetical protein
MSKYLSAAHGVCVKTPSNGIWPRKCNAFAVDQAFLKAAKRFAAGIAFAPQFCFGSVDYRAYEQESQTFEVEEET